MNVLYYILVFGGSALMAFNIYSYIVFEEKIKKQKYASKVRKLFFIPIILLILFFIGYVVVGILEDSLVVGFILFGGSIFVYAMLWFMKRAVGKIQENEHIEAQLEVAEEANKAKNFFLSNMTHDLRTPLNAIIGYTELFKKDRNAIEEHQDYVDKIDKAGHQLLEIINNVLEMSQIENGKLELEPGLANLEESVNKVVAMAKPKAEEKGLNFVSSVDVENKWAMFDSNLMNRVLVNLLSNAIKFTDAGGSVSLSLKQTGKDNEMGHYEFHIKDNGVGMDPELVENLFKPFERERTSTVSKLQGTGLGLAITKSIVDLAGGKIEVITDKGKGTEVIVSVSLETREDVEEKVVEKNDNIRFDGYKALLVEDNLINLEIAQMLLSSLGFKYDSAENGKVAVEKISMSKPGDYDVVLMDIMMPVMDGYEATKAIRSLPDRQLASIPIVAMTANALKEDVQMAKEAFMDGHIGKPIDINHMVNTLKTVLIDKKKAFD